MQIGQAVKNAEMLRISSFEQFYSEFRECNT